MILPNSKTIKDTVLTAVHQTIVKELETQLKGTDATALMLDGWDADSLLGKLTGVMFYFFDKDWAPVRAYIDLIQITVNHTSMHFNYIYGPYVLA